MSAPLSVIIPTLNAQTTLIGCFEALGVGLMHGLIREVIVVDGGSNDATLEIATEAGARTLVGRRGRSAQLRCGAVNARGSWFLFLHADTQLSDNWPEAVLAHFTEHPDKAGTFELAYDTNDRGARWLERRANWRARTFGLPYGDQGLLVPRSLYDKVGGFPDIPLMEDVAIVRAIGKQRLETLNAKAVTSAEKYQRDGYRKRAYRNTGLLVRYLLGASPEKLAKSYD